MTGFAPRTSGIGSDRSTNWATQPLPKTLKFVWHCLWVANLINALWLKITMFYGRADKKITFSAIPE